MWCLSCCRRQARSWPARGGRPRCARRCGSRPGGGPGGRQADRWNPMPATGSASPMWCRYATVTNGSRSAGWMPGVTHRARSATLGCARTASAASKQLLGVTGGPGRRPQGAGLFGPGCWVGHPIRVRGGCHHPMVGGESKRHMNGERRQGASPRVGPLVWTRAAVDRFGSSVQ